MECSNNVCGCTYNGASVQMGATVPKGDGCNQCTCQNSGQMVCTTRPVPCGCTHNGNSMAIGATFQNGCNTCVCQSSGTVSCTNNPCNCQYMGRTLQFGQVVLSGCNTCTCKQTGQVRWIHDLLRKNKSIYNSPIVNKKISF